MSIAMIIKVLLSRRKKKKVRNPDTKAKLLEKLLWVNLHEITLTRYLNSRSASVKYKIP